MMKLKMTLACSPGELGSRELGTASFSPALQECDTQGRVYVGVVLIRRGKQAYSLGLCGKKGAWRTIGAGEVVIPDIDK